MKIRNKSQREQCVCGIPAFEAGESRDVSQVEARKLLNNPNFEIVERQKAPSSKKSKKEED